jgi:hypothetical protein
MKAMYECPVCGTTSAAGNCCGVWLSAPFTMTTERIKALRRYAHGQKGLDADAYHLHVKAVGATSTTTLTRDQHTELLRRLGRLPDRKRQAKGASA